MPIQEHDAEILRLLARYYVLTREQIQRVLFPGRANGRSTRKKLSRLQRAGAIRKHRIPVVLPGTNGGAPVWYLAKEGTEILASYFDDERFLVCNTAHPRGDRLSHWIALNETRMTVEAAIALQSVVTMPEWINEWEVCDKDAAEGRRFTLHTQLREEPPLSCSPDAGFVLEVRDRRKVFYLERDLGTSSPRQVAARKHKGYAALARVAGHRRHFPTTNVDAFSVLVVTNSAYRVRRIGRELRTCESPELWLLVDEHDLTPETFLHAAIVHDHQGVAAPLVNPPDTTITVHDADPSREVAS